MDCTPLPLSDRKNFSGRSCPAFRVRERPQNLFRTLLNYTSAYLQFSFTFSEIQLPYLKDPEGFSLAVESHLFLSASRPSGLLFWPLIG